MRAYARGIKQLDFTTKEGERVKGTQVFYTYASDGVVGEAADKIFLRQDFPIPPDLAPGKAIDIFCDTKGRVEHIQVVNTTK